MKVDGFAIAGLSQTIETINRTAKERRRLPQHWKILQTMIEQRSSAYKVGCELLKEAIPNAEYFNTKIEKSQCPRGKPCNGTVDYLRARQKPGMQYRLLAQEIEEMNA